MKAITRLFIIFLTIYSFQSTAQKNISLLSVTPYPGTLAGVWHYAKNGKEYALVGTQTGISIVDVTIPTVPQSLFMLPGVNSLWHELKVTGDYAYAVSEGLDNSGVMNGLQVINLSYLPDSVPNHFWQGDGAIAGQLANAHSVTTDEGYVYINGHRVPGYNNGVLIASLSDPWNPHFVGAETLRYCHDSYVRGDTLWTSDIQAGVFSVYDITNRASPVLLATQQTPYAFNHNAWLSDDGHYLYTTDERSGAPIGSFDVSDLTNIQLVDQHYTINMQPAEAHNVRVINDFIINASYGSQVTIIDAAHPDNLIEVGNYPTGTGLCWDADPYLPSGNILATDTWGQTFFVLKPTYIRACYLEGLVTDSITGLPLTNVTIDMLTTYVHESTDLTGHYKTGIADSGSYQIQFSKTGYITKTISRTLDNGVLTTLDVQLVPDNVSTSEIAAESLVKVKSNPSADIVIEVSPTILRGSTTLELAVYDNLGRVVFSKSPLKETMVHLDKNTLSSGTYYFSLRDGSKIISGGKLMFVSTH